jgi:chemotaxis protein CheX
MDVRYVNPFLNATKHVIKTMSGVEITPGKPYVKKDLSAKGDVTGVIGVMGQTKGTISVTFTEAAILPIVSSMLGEPITGLSVDVRDAVGELTNMISGQARRDLVAMGMVLEGAIPSVIMGRDHSVSHITGGPILAIPFTTPNGEMTVEVCLL